MVHSSPYRTRAPTKVVSICWRERHMARRGELASPPGMRIPWADWILTLFICREGVMVKQREPERYAQRRKLRSERAATHPRRALAMRNGGDDGSEVAVPELAKGRE